MKVFAWIDRGYNGARGVVVVAEGRTAAETLAIDKLMKTARGLTREDAIEFLQGTPMHELGIGDAVVIDM